MLNWAERNEAWEGRAKALGKRAVLHVGHRTPEEQARVTAEQRTLLLPLFEGAVRNKGVSRTLDFGCGVGRWTHDLQRITSGLVLGVDPTQPFLDVCEAERVSPSVDYKLYRDGRIPAEDESFDAVWCCMVLSTVLTDEMLRATVLELRRVTRHGGLMFLVDNTAGPPHRPVVRSPYSISRTVEEYQREFAGWVALREVGAYVDLGETNSAMLGYRR